MSQDDGIYREVDQELEEEKQIRQLKESAPWLIAGAFLVVAIIGGKQWWDAHRLAEAEENATAFASAEAVALEGEEEAATWSTFRADAPAGYAAMAAFREASVEANNGDRAGAIAALSAVSENEALPERMRNFARLRAAYLALDTSGEEAMVILSGLETEENVIGAYAREVAGLAAMQSGNYDTALSHFNAIDLVGDIPPALAERASQYKVLAQLGADGVSLEPQSLGQSLEQLLDLPESPAEQGEADGELMPEAAQAEVDTTAGEPDAASEEVSASDENDTQEDGTSGN